MKNFLFIFLLIFVTGCGQSFNEFGDQKILKKLEPLVLSEKLKKCGDSLAFKIDTLTDFQWDKVYFIYSYAGKSEILGIIGTQWEALPDDFRIAEGAHLWIFIKNNKVINYANMDGYTLGKAAAFKNELANSKDIFFTPQTAFFYFTRTCKRHPTERKYDSNYIELVQKK